MTSKSLQYVVAGMGIMTVLTCVFLGSQPVLAEEADDEEISNEVFEQLCDNGLTFFECSDGGNGDGDESGVPVDPCEDVFPQIPNPGMGCTDEDPEEPGEPEDPVDVCPGMNGVQTSTDECPGNGGGGGGGGTLPACSDTLDNDGDGQTDLNDSDCTDSQDNDESTLATSGGGGGGGGGGYFAPATMTATTTGEVLGATTTDPLPDVACDAFLTTFIKPKGDNDTEQVTRLQSVLKIFEGHELETTGVYDEPTIDAVHAFQTKYAGDILTPWGISQSTGFVYLTTRKKVNEVYCENKVAFPLSDEEQQLLNAGQSNGQTNRQTNSVAAAVAALVPEVTYHEPEPAVEVTATEEAEEVKTTEEDSAVQSPWSRVTDFFKRLLNRAR